MSYSCPVYDFEHPRYKPEQRKEARRLRREEGLSVGGIAKQLHVAKSSVSLWVRDVKLTQKQKEALHMRKVEGGKRGWYGSVGAVHRLRDMAQRLKMAGAANVEIASLLDVPQATVSRWVHGIELSAEQKKDLVFRSQSLRYCKERLKFKEEGRQIAQKMEALPSQGCMLYWAEGNNYVGHRGAGFTNSNPKMVALFLAFIRRY